MNDHTSLQMAMRQANDEARQDEKPEALQELLDKAATDPVYAAMRFELVEALLRYAYHGIPPGGFLRAVLHNDLLNAVGRADDHSLRVLRTIVMFCYLELPHQCWGSQERVTVWLARFKDGN